MVNESELILLLRSGNEAAFAELVASYQIKVLNICYRFLLNRADAEDISQEVFIEIFHSIGRFRGDSSLGTWIYRIAVTKSLDELKRQSRKKRISSIGKSLGLEMVANLISGKDQPDTTMEEKEQIDQLMKALNKLQDSQRVALTLSKLEGYSTMEIAEIMKTTATAVDSLIYRGKQNLKLFLKQ